MVDMSSTDDWDELTDEQRRYNAKRMAVYAGMVEAMDFHIGRLVAYLESSGQIDDTIRNVGAVLEDIPEASD